MRLAIFGAGAVGLGSAAVARQHGHDPVLWSPGLAATPGRQAVECRDAVQGAFPVEVAATTGDALGGADAVLICLPGWAHKDAYDALAGTGMPVIVSSHASMGGLYAARRRPGLVVAWGTTLVTGRRTCPLACTLSNVRSGIDVAAVPSAATPAALALCATLFGGRFRARDGLVAIQLSNVNPQNHMAMLLCNLTRADRGEDWGNYWGISPAVGVLMEALDRERLAIAAAFGVQVRTVHEHFALSFDVPIGTMYAMAAAVDARGNAPLGPKSLEGRYVDEDVPYGLVVTEALGRIAAVPTPLHTAGIELFGAMRGRDYRAMNALLTAAGLDDMTAMDLSAAVGSGR